MRKFLFIIFPILLISLNICAEDSYYQNNPSCVIDRGNPKRTGVYLSPAVQNYHGVRWQASTEPGTPICADNFIITATPAAYCYNSGKLKWKTHIRKRFNIVPTYYKGLIYSLDNTNLIGYEVNTGLSIKKYGNLISTITSLLIYDDIAYISSWNPPSIIAYSLKNKKIIWFYSGVETNGLSTDGKKLYFLDSGIAIYALDRKSGKLIWKNQFLAGGGYVTIYKNCAYYASATADGYGGVTSLNKDTGQIIWNNIFAKRGIAILNLAAEDNKIFVSAANASRTSLPSSGIYALDARNGKIIWHFHCDPISSPIIAEDVLYVKAKNKFYAIHIYTGKELWHINLNTAHNLISNDDPIFYHNKVFLTAMTQQGIKIFALE